MNKNQKILIVVVAIIIATGFCIYITKKVNANSRASRKNNNRIKKVEEGLNKVVLTIPKTDMKTTIEEVSKQYNTFLNDQSVQVFGANIKEGAEEKLRKITNEQSYFTPDAISDLIETPIEATPSKNTASDNVIEAIQFSDSELNSNIDDSDELATEEEMYTKISSLHGEDSLHEDLRKLNRKMDEEDVEELIKNISFYCPEKPITKRFETKFKSVLSLMHFFSQIYEKHKIKADRAEKYAKIMINNFEKLKNNSVESITTNWRKPERHKTRNQLKANEDLILL